MLESIPLYLPALAAGAMVLLAVVALWRKPHQVADWTFIIGMMAFGGERASHAMSLHATEPAGVLTWQLVRITLASFLPGIWLLFSLTYARGNSAEFLQRWRPAWLAALILPPAMALVFFRQLAAPSLSSDGLLTLRIGMPGVALYSLLLVGTALVVLNLERTYRSSVGTTRWKIKYLVLGLVLLFVVRIYTGSQTVLFRTIDPNLETLNSIAAILAVALMPRSLVRSQRFDLGVYPSQSMLHRSVTIVVIGAYLLIVGVFAKIVAHFGGDAAFALKAFLVLVSLVLLAIVLQSDRVRLHVRQFLSRNFQRPIYDYRAIWRRFTDGTATSVEQGDFCRSSVSITADIFHALAVSLWLLNERRDTFILAASTSLTGAKATEVAPSGAEIQDVMAYFATHPEPVDIESRDASWAIALRRWHPSDFPQGGNRLCMPLLRQRHLVGVLVLGDRVSGVEFPSQDMDLLRCIGDQIAAGLLNIQMSQRLLQAKEMEAFQTMATFFVHDLKNAASTLNLMVKNLPVHFDDPAFRADALRGMEKTVSHINRMISRLGQLRNELRIQPTAQDLNEFVKRSLHDLAPAQKTAIVQELAPVARTLFDREQLQKVLLNLVLNATEAIPPGRTGEVRVGTKQEGGWNVLSVSDNGCGMTEEFVQRSLFRAFQTTKQHGLGIGMFQSRMIVEAHGGRIHVSSKVGNGTTFQIFLPVRSEEATR